MSDRDAFTQEQSHARLKIDGDEVPEPWDFVSPARVQQQISTHHEAGRDGPTKLGGSPQVDTVTVRRLVRGQRGDIELFRTLNRRLHANESIPAEVVEQFYVVQGGERVPFGTGLRYKGTIESCQLNDGEQGQQGPRTVEVVVDVESIR